jgi:hypothetical protein
MPSSKVIRAGEAAEVWDMGGTFGQRAETAITGEPTGVRLGRGIKDWNRFEYEANFLKV